MNAQTRLSEKGQIVIPKDVRTRLGLDVGDRFDVIERPDGVLLRKTPAKKGESFEAITDRLRARVRYDGPPISIEDMDASIAEMWAAGGPRWDD